MCPNLRGLFRISLTVLRNGSGVLAFLACISMLNNLSSCGSSGRLTSVICPCGDTGEKTVSLLRRIIGNKNKSMCPPMSDSPALAGIHLERMLSRGESISEKNRCIARLFPFLYLFFSPAGYRLLLSSQLKVEQVSSFPL
jgi:hypothetical protein